MKGVVLAGGLGTRLAPMTQVVNKHLLDVYDEPMIYHPIRRLAAAGLRDVLVVTGDEIVQFKRLLGDGSAFGISLEYAYQSGERGIADALSRAEPFAAGEPVCVILGDNVFGDDLMPSVKRFRASPPAGQGAKGARLLLKRVSPEDARRFGCVRFDPSDPDRIQAIVEKPSRPPSDLVVTGCYVYDARCFDFIRTLPPSARGETEVTDLNNIYVEEGTMGYDVLKGWWTDAGTPESKLRASILVAREKGVSLP